MPPFNVLEPHLTILGRHFLEASAGTGKTFAIEHLVVRLLLQEESSMKLDQILLVTFTRAATRELKRRIRSNLEKAIEGLSTGEGFPYLMPYREKERAKAVQKIEQALHHFDEAQIFTIHGFCYRMLKEFALEADFTLSSCDPDAESPLYKGALREEVKDFLRTGLQSASYSLLQLELVLKKFKQDSHRLIESLAYLLEEGDKRVPQRDFDKERDPNKILLQMVYECQLSRENQSHRPFLSPDEILKKMESALEKHSFLKRASERYCAAIIDEFQDTDAVQWKVFEKLFLTTHSPAAFYLVGDPKQSIYAFRSADIYTYLNAAEKMETKCSLETNFRSEPPLLHALNAFFSAAPWMELPELQTVLPFHPVKSAYNEGTGAFHFMIATAEATRERKWPSTHLEEALLFPFIAEECQKYPEDQVAVLVKDRYQAERLHLYLKKEAIPSVMKRGGEFQELSLFSALESLLMAAYNPSHLSGLKAALGSPLIGWTALDLLSEEKIEKGKRGFEQLQLALQEGGFALFFERFQKLFSPLICSILRGLVEQIVSRRGDPLAALKELREERIELKQQEQPGDIVIMTIHMSKGLEFDVVFALGAASRQIAKEDFMRTKEGLLSFDGEDPHCQRALKERDAEKLRQLYVALTRAKKHLYLPLILDPEKKTESPSPVELFLEKALGKWPNRSSVTAFIEKLALQGGVVSHFIDEKKSFLTHSEKPMGVRREKKKNLPSLIVPPARVKSERILSFSALKPLHKEELSLFPSREKSPNELPAGTVTGVILHRILEKLLQAGLHHPYQKRKCEELIEREIKGSLLENHKEDIASMLEQALHLPLAQFALVDIPTSSMLMEMEFLFPNGETLIKGFADLCFEWQGSYYILDWKSNWLADYGLASLEKAMRDNDYFLQAALYAEALKRYVKQFYTELRFGGAFYCFLRGPAIYHYFPGEMV